MAQGKASFKRSLSFFLLLITASVWLGGCFVVLEEEKIIYGIGKAKFYETNMVKGSPFVGILFIQCKPSRRAAVKQYFINIDKRPSLLVEKESDVKIYLDAGKHKLVIGAVGFGWATQKRILVRENKQTALTYYGPYWSWSRGVLK